MWRLHTMTTGAPHSLDSYHKRECDARQAIAVMFPQATRVTPYTYHAKDERGMVVGMTLAHL